MQAQEFIKNGLRLMNLETDYLTADDASYQRGFNIFIGFLSMLEKLELKIFSGVVSDIKNLSSEVPVEPYSWNAITYGFSLYAAPLMGASQSIDQATLMMAERLMSQVYAVAGAPVNSVFPGNLPVGSGNYEGCFWPDKFYPDCDPEIYQDCDDSVLSESGIPIVTG